MEFSKILSSHPMTIPTLLMLFKSHSLSNKTPVKILHNVLHKSTTIVDTGVFPVIHQPIREKTCAELLEEEQEANIVTQPFLYSVIPQPPQEEMTVEFLQEKRNQMDYVKPFLRKFNRISFLRNAKGITSQFELVSSEVMEIVISDVGGIDDDILLTIKDDILCENLFNVNLLIANIEALNDNPTLSSDLMAKSSSTSLLEETNTFDNSLPEFETFCFDLKEICSGSPTTRSDISLPEYKAFYGDHVKEISSGSTITHSDSFLYDSFIFDLLINPFPLADRSDFYEFTDELAHNISPPKYDCLCFKNEPNSGDFTMDVVEDTFPTREPRVHNALPTHPTFQLNLDFLLSSESFFAYVVWIFLFFLIFSCSSISSILRQ
uniref:Reverse transcriptase domain-containing protein n=1 Tax=Tanacetum cinerariifolium TaxID=118510 RepID=A0A699K4D8_TANCI|nr:hypothetical protein [Tanacetum cinerariifolium]